MPRANLLNEEWRAHMTKVLIDKGIKLWVIDNIASLAPGINENAKEDWDPINAWLLELRFAGIATILLHHVGKGGSQRGTSAREDNIDTSIVLKQPDNYQSDDGCRFVMQFKKNRVVSGDHFLIADQEFKYEHGKWDYDNPKTKNKYMVWKMLDEGKPQNEIAEELNLSKGRVSQIRKKGVDGGYLSNNGKLTPFGREKVDKN
jgi:putative DNA primase/helicase